MSRLVDRTIGMSLVDGNACCGFARLSPSAYAHGLERAGVRYVRERSADDTQPAAHGSPAAQKSATTVW